jgi:hypothetical protein
MADLASSQESALVHIWNRCRACGVVPIAGLRFTCQTCPAGADNDLCEACYRRFERGQLEHPALEAREAPAGSHVFRSFEGTPRQKVLPWLAVPWSTAAPSPRVPDRAVIRPEFRSGRESFFGSYGFVIAGKDGGQRLVITALHVLDEIAKFRGIDCSLSNATYTGFELPKHITGIQLYDPFAPKWMLAELGTAADMLPLPNARINAVEPYSQRDIAAFRVASAASLQPLRLAQSTPTVGEPIWLAAKLRPDAAERTAQAIVVEMTPETFVFRFATAMTSPTHTSGAPLLNRAGEVVGINVGGGILDGHKLGHGVHSASIRHHLDW